jgi:hypothetical protein
MTAATPHLLALHGWTGPEGTFAEGDPVPALDSKKELSPDREKELIAGGYVKKASEKAVQKAIASAETDLPGQ